MSSDLFIYSYKYLYKLCNNLYKCYNFSFSKADDIISCLQMPIHNAVKDCIQELIATGKLLTAVAMKWVNRIGEATHRLHGLWSWRRS